MAQAEALWTRCLSAVMLCWTFYFCGATEQTLTNGAGDWGKEAAWARLPTPQMSWEAEWQRISDLSWIWFLFSWFECDQSTGSEEIWLAWFQCDRFFLKGPPLSKFFTMDISQMDKKILFPDRENTVSQQLMLMQIRHLCRSKAEVEGNC